MSELPLRAAFTRDDGIAFDLLRATVGVPLPKPAPASGLPRRVVLELDERELRILGESGTVVLESWSRGALTARVNQFGRASVELKLRWPEGGRAGTLRAEDSPAAVALAELLAQDTRVAAGTDRAADEGVRRLATATLPEKLRLDYDDELRAVSALLAPGERPVALAVADFGIALLTDRALSWWAGGRRQPVVIPRAEVRFAAAADDVLLVDDGGDGRRLEPVEPPGRAAELAAALQPRSGLDELLASERDLDLLGELRPAFEPLRARWREGERGELIARADVGVKGGALVLTDRRLLWGPRKANADPVVLERCEVARAETSRMFGVTQLTVSRQDGGELRFEAVGPDERAAALRSALLRQPRA